MYSSTTKGLTQKYSHENFVNYKVDQTKLSAKEKELLTFNYEVDQKYFIATCEERKDYYINH